MMKMMTTLLLALTIQTTTAFRLPAPRARAIGAAVATSPFPAFALHELAPGSEWGDVLMDKSAFLSAGLGLAGSVVAFSFFFDFCLKYGADEGCVISRATGDEVCGYVIDRGEQGCVLSDSEGWVCS